MNTKIEAIKAQLVAVAKDINLKHNAGGYTTNLLDVYGILCSALHIEGEESFINEVSKSNSLVWTLDKENKKDYWKIA